MRFFCLSACMIWLGSGSVLAGDYYFGCASPNSRFHLSEDGKKLALFEEKKKLDYQLIRKITLEERQGFCTTKSGQKFAWNAHRYIVDLKTRTNDPPIELSFLCEQGSSGTPAMVSDCTMSTTSSKQLEPGYTFQKPGQNEPLNLSANKTSNEGSSSWSSFTDGSTATAIYAWSSGCKKDCNDEVDYQPIISIDCSRKSSSAIMTFWELGREKEVDTHVGIWITIDDHTTRLNAKGAPKLTGVSLDLTLPLSHPLFEELASGDTITYGSYSGTRGQQISLKGSGKNIRRMLAACRK